MNDGRRGGAHRGRLLVLEGLDGCGKTTQLPRLAARLRAAGHTVVETREPYDCPAGRLIREAAQHPGRATPEQERDWFFEQRAEHVREVVAPALARGEVVLSDRYFLSTVAYQGARGLDAEELLRESEARFPVPDLVLLLDLDPEAGLARVDAGRGVREAAFEQAGFLARARERFLAVRRPWLVRVDAAGSPDAVEARIASAVAERTGLLPG